MGDSSYGQMIRRKVPMKEECNICCRYSFKDAIQTNDDMAEEAKLVFESSTKLFQELMELDGE